MQINSRVVRGLLLALGGGSIATLDAALSPHPLTEIQPRAYTSYRAGGPIQVDGRLDEPSWQRAEWTEDFTGVEGGTQGASPRLRTRVKLVWDDQLLLPGRRHSGTSCLGYAERAGCDDLPRQ